MGDSGVARGMRSDGCGGEGSDRENVRRIKSARGGVTEQKGGRGDSRFEFAHELPQLPDPSAAAATGFVACVGALDGCSSAAMVRS